MDLDPATKPSRSLWLSFGLVPVLMLVAMFSLISRPDSPQSMSLKPPSPSGCLPRTPFQPSYQRDLGGVRPSAQGLEFWGVSWASAQACGAGTLHLTVQGQPAGGKNPRLLLTWQSRTLLDESFGPELVQRQIHIPGPGLITLGYFNDFYRSEVRAAWMQQVVFSGAGCRGLELVGAPPGAPANWQREIVLTGAQPLIFKPCAAGTLELILVGRQAAGASPMLQFEQGGKILRTIAPQEKRQLLRIPVRGLALTIRLQNPYFKELADRNVWIRRVMFVPEVPPAGSTSP